MAIMVRTMRQPVKLLSQKDEASMARYFCEHEHKTSTFSGWNLLRTRQKEGSLRDFVCDKW